MQQRYLRILQYELQIIIFNWFTRGGLGGETFGDIKYLKRKKERGAGLERKKNEMHSASVGSRVPEEHQLRCLCTLHSVRAHLACAGLINGFEEQTLT